MLNYNIQFFGGRGASGTMKNPNGKVIKSKSSGEKGGSGGSDKDTSGKSEEQTLKEIASKYATDSENRIYTDEKEKEIKANLAKSIKKETGMGTFSAEKAATRIINESRDQYDGKPYYKDSNGNLVDVKIGGNTNFGLVKKDGGKATVYIAFQEANGVSTVKPITAHIYNVDGRDIAIHNVGKGSWTATDVATGLGLGLNSRDTTREKTIARIRDNGYAAIVRDKVGSFDDRRSIETFKLIQKKLAEEKNRKKR